MSASISGLYPYVEILLKMGANPWKKSCNDLIAIEWAKRFNKNDVVELTFHQFVCSLGQSSFIVLTPGVALHPTLPLTE